MRQAMAIRQDHSGPDAGAGDADVAPQRLWSRAAPSPGCRSGAAQVEGPRAPNDLPGPPHLRASPGNRAAGSAFSPLTHIATRMPRP